MSNNPPPYGTAPDPGQQPYGPPPGAGQPYGPPPRRNPGGFPGQQPAYATPYGPPGGFGAPPARSKKWYQRWWVWLIIVGVVVIGGAIGWGVNHVSKYQLQDKIKEAFSDQNRTLTDVKCPGNVKTDKGSTATCTAVENGKTETLRVVFDEDRHFIVTIAG